MAANQVTGKGHNGRSGLHEGSKSGNQNQSGDPFLKIILN